MKTTKLEKLYSCLKGYQSSIEEASFKLDATAQDLDYLLEEIEQWIDEERNYNDGPSNTRTVIDNDDDDGIPFDTDADGQ